MPDQDEEVPGGAASPPHIGKVGGDQPRMATLPLGSL